MSAVIRCSTLPNWPDCERRGAAKAFRKDVIAAGFHLAGERQNIGAAVGISVHKGASVTLIEKMQTGQVSPESSALDAAVETIRTEAHAGIIFDDETPNQNHAEKTVVRMVRTYRAYLEPELEPIAVEERLEADAGNGIILSGQSDLVARYKNRRLEDLKGGKWRGHYKPQLGGYSLLVRTHNLPVDEVAERWIKRVPLSKQQPEPQTFIHDQAGAEVAALRTLHRIGEAITAFRESGEPWEFLANPNSKLCSAKWCPAHGTNFCREHREGVER